MYTFILIADRLPHINWPRLLLKDFASLRREPSGRLIAEEGNEWIAISADERLSEDYDESEIESISSVFPNPIFMLVEGRGKSLANRIIMNIDNSCNLLIDNDHGLILPVEEIKSRIHAGRDWMIEKPA